MKYKEVLVSKGPLYTKKIKQVNEDKFLPMNKGVKRSKIENSVFDVEDSVADNAKLIGVLLYAIKILVEDVINEDQLQPQNYEVLTTIKDIVDQYDHIVKDKISEGKLKELLEKLLSRQESIRNVLKS